MHRHNITHHSIINLITRHTIDHTYRRRITNLQSTIRLIAFTHPFMAGIMVVEDGMANTEVAGMVAEKKGYDNDSFIFGP